MAAFRPLRLRYSTRAKSQLLAINDYIRDEAGAKVAARVGAKLRDAAELIQRFPQVGRPGRVPGTREWVVHQAPYIVVYELFPVDPIEIVILGRQDRS